MRLVLHPKVRSDVDAIMEYYERVASRELADDFCTELRASCWRPRSDPSRLPSVSATYIARLLNDVAGAAGQAEGDTVAPKKKKAKKQ